MPKFVQPCVTCWPRSAPTHVHNSSPATAGNPIPGAIRAGFTWRGHASAGKLPILYLERENKGAWELEKAHVENSRLHALVLAGESERQGKSRDRGDYLYLCRVRIGDEIEVAHLHVQRVHLKLHRARVGQ